MRRATIRAGNSFRPINRRFRRGVLIHFQPSLSTSRRNIVFVLERDVSGLCLDHGIVSIRMEEFFIFLEYPFPLSPQGIQKDPRTRSNSSTCTPLLRLAACACSVGPGRVRDINLFRFPHALLLMSGALAPTLLLYEPVI